MFVASVLGALLYSVSREPVLDEATLREQGTYVLPAPRAIAPFDLVDTHGDPFNNQSLQGHWSLLYFGFTSCPDVCPTTLSVLAQVESQLAETGKNDLLEQLRIYLITVDPERDSLEVLGQYVTAFSPKLTGVTGSLEALAALAKQLNVAFMKVPDPNGGYVVDHTGNLILIDPDGRYFAFLKMPHTPEKVIAAYTSIADSF
jgi:protein SCO1/2